MNDPLMFLWPSGLAAYSARARWTLLIVGVALLALIGPVDDDRPAGPGPAGGPTPSTYCRPELVRCRS